MSILDRERNFDVLVTWWNGATSHCLLKAADSQWIQLEIKEDRGEEQTPEEIQNVYLEADIYVKHEHIKFISRM